MMNLLDSYDSWVPLYFGTLGSLNVLLFVVVIYYWYRSYSLTSSEQKSISLWTMSGCFFLFFAGYFACGIGGQPGFLLSPDESLHNYTYAYRAAMLGMACNVPGWFCMLMAQRKMMLISAKNEAHVN